MNGIKLSIPESEIQSINYKQLEPLGKKLIVLNDGYMLFKDENESIYLRRESEVVNLEGVISNESGHQLQGWLAGQADLTALNTEQAEINIADDGTFDLGKICLGKVPNEMGLTFDENVNGYRESANSGQLFIGAAYENGLGSFIMEYIFEDLQEASQNLQQANLNLMR